MNASTSPEAVEKLASQCQSAERALSALNEFPSGQRVLSDAAATLRTLSAENAALKAEIVWLGDELELAKARNRALGRLNDMQSNMLEAFCLDYVNLKTRNDTRRHCRS
jgi:cell division protein FtsB